MQGNRAGCATGCATGCASRCAEGHPEHGSITAEFAILMPAVIVVLACCLGAVQLVGQQVRLTDAAAAGSRSLARGDGTRAASDLVYRMIPEAGGSIVVVTQRRGEFVCMTLEATSEFRPAQALGITVSATGCALEGGL